MSDEACSLALAAKVSLVLILDHDIKLVKKGQVYVIAGLGLELDAR